MPHENKERVELQFNMSNEAEKELINFIDQNGTTRAGFIKSVVRQYMNTMQSLMQNSASQNTEPNKKQTTSKRSKKKISTSGSSFSSKDFD